MNRLLLPYMVLSQGHCPSIVQTFPCALNFQLTLPPKFLQVTMPSIKRLGTQLETTTPIDLSGEALFLITNKVRTLKSW